MVFFFLLFEVKQQTQKPHQLLNSGELYLRNNVNKSSDYKIRH